MQRKLLIKFNTIYDENPAESRHRRNIPQHIKHWMKQSHSKHAYQLWKLKVQFSSVQSLSRVWLFPTPWTAAHQASLSNSNCRSLHKPMSIESVMQYNHLILGRPLLLPHSNFPSIKLFFKWVSSSHQVAKVLEFQIQHQSFHWTHRTDLL